MGFLSGVVTGLALAAGAAAWYMSRSGERFRDQYQVDRKLGELGDELEVRTREIQSTVNAQIAEMRAKGSTKRRPRATPTPRSTRPARPRPRRQPSSRPMSRTRPPRSRSRAKDVASE